MKIKIKYFGLIAEALNKQEEVLELPQSISLEELKTRLVLQYPILKEKEYQIAVNQELINNNLSFDIDTEIALLPPFAGG